MSIGPQIPDELLKKLTNRNSEDASSDKTLDSAPKQTIGPQIPVSKNKKQSPEIDNQSFGPALPPGVGDEQEALPAPKVIGPAMPPPGVLLSVNDSDDDDDGFGPLPASSKADEEYALRKAQFENEKNSESGKLKREEWMTELPAKLTNYGLGARTFRKNAAPDRGEASSAWTESPLDKKEKNEKEKEVAKVNKYDTERDQEMEKMANELGKERGTALFDEHIRKRQADSAIDSSAPKERRPFNRETDLQIMKGPSGIAGAKKLKEKAGQLSSRFGNASSKKYL